MSEPACGQIWVLTATSSGMLFGSRFEIHFACGKERDHDGPHEAYKRGKYAGVDRTATVSWAKS